jgi:16S rRNA (cytidine1402-2'-O)-methyltransferase
VPCIGPSAVLMAIISSGFNGQNFAFNGYLPIPPEYRIKKIKELERKAVKEDQAQFFIETPFRNTKLFNDLLKVLNENTFVSIATDIKGENQFIETKTCRQWQHNPIPKFDKIPTVFGIGT